MSKLKGKVAIVTGASKGIGASIAKHFAAEGASVIVNYATSKEGADKVVSEIVSKDGKAFAVQGDVSNFADVKRLFEETKKQFGRLDILVNNAGIFKMEPLEEITEKEFHREFNTNVLGPILTVQESLKYFGPEGGSVINVGSVVSVKAFASSVVYAGTKGALDVVNRNMALELGARKIRVNILAPGPVETEGFHAAGIGGTEAEKQMASQIYLGRIGQPEDIAKAAVFLASDDSAWVTGERLTASGGF